MDFSGLDFKFTGFPPWTFPSVRISLFLLNRVKAFHFPSELRCSALEDAPLHAPSVPIYNNGSKSREGVGCVDAFPDLDVFISLPVVSSIITVELCVIFFALSSISFHDNNNFIIYSDSRSVLQALGSLYTHNTLVLKMQRFLCDFQARRKCLPFCWIPSHVGLSIRRSHRASW